MGHRGIGWALAFVLCACNGDGEDDKTPTDSDADTDADADSDTDTDADTDNEGPDADGDGFGAEVDCDDADGAVYPGAPDLCGDDKVTNCDRTSDDGLVTLDGSQGFDNLQAAMSAAGEGSELLLCSGTFVGQFEATVPVRLVAYTDATTTILSGSMAGSTLSLPGGSEVIGLTVQDGRAGQRGGGIRMTSAGTLLVQDSVIANNRASQGGGILVAPDSEATFVNTVLSDNAAELDGGGAYVSEGATLDLSQGSTVTNNSSQYGAAGIELVGATLIGGVVSNNILYSYASISYSSSYLYYDGPFAGGGIGALGVSRVEGTEVFDNVGIHGAGITITAGDLTLVDVLVHDNNTDMFDGVGGGVGAVGGSLRMEGTTEVYANTGVQGGGAFALGATVTGGILRDNTASEFGGGIMFWNSTLQDITITGNSATDAGGGVYVVDDGTLIDVEISGNGAAQGGGLGTTLDYGYASSRIDIQGGTFSGNDAVEGGAIYSSWTLETAGTQIVDNTASRGAGVFVAGRRVRLGDGAMLRNIADTEGGGAFLENGTELITANVDFGSDADDNLPSDVQAGEVYTDFGAGTSVVCEEGSCAP